MSAAAWACNCCDTNNLATADSCRVCGAAKVTAAGAVPGPTMEVRLPNPAGKRPAFVESRHAVDVKPPAPSRIRLAGPSPRPTRAPFRPAPPAPELVPPPPRWSPPRSGPPVTYVPADPAPYRPTGSGSGRGLRTFLVWLALAFAVWLVASNWDSIVALLPDGNGTSSGNTGTSADNAVVGAGTACPAAAAKWLPDGTGARLEASFTTPRHVITICRTASGGLYYDGQLSGQAPSQDTHISIPATATASGYLARNQTYAYEITGTEVIVSNNGSELARHPLTRTGP